MAMYHMSSHWTSDEPEREMIWLARKTAVSRFQSEGGMESIMEKHRDPVPAATPGCSPYFQTARIPPYTA
jgi:hypothetical protein